MKKSLLVMLALGILMPGIAGAMLDKKKEKMSKAEFKAVYQYIKIKEDLKTIEKLENTFKSNGMNILELAKKDNDVKKIIERKKQLLQQLKQNTNHNKKPQLKKVIKKQKSEIKEMIPYLALDFAMVLGVASFIWYIWKRKTK